MKKLLFVGAVALALAACSNASPTAPTTRNVKPAPVLHDGIPCTTEDGRSGYMVSLGDRCQAS